MLADSTIKKSADLLPTVTTAWRGRGTSDWLLVAAVAQRLVATGFAATKIDLPAFSGAVFHRCEAAPLVRSIAKRLVLALAAGAPPVVLPLLHVDCERCVGCSVWLVSHMNSRMYGAAPTGINGWNKLGCEHNHCARETVAMCNLATPAASFPSTCHC
jgi:hypothetical protein